MFSSLVMEDLEVERVTSGTDVSPSLSGSLRRACGTPLILGPSENGSLSNVSFATDGTGSGTVTSDDSELVLTESSTEALASRSRDDVSGSSTSREGVRRRSLAGKIQQLLTPSRKPSRTSLLRKTGSMSETPSPLVFEQHHGWRSHRRPESTASEVRHCCSHAVTVCYDLAHCKDCRAPSSVRSLFLPELGVLGK